MSYDPKSQDKPGTPGQQGGKPGTPNQQGGKPGAPGNPFQKPLDKDKDRK